MVCAWVADTYTRVLTYVYARTCIRIRAYVHTCTRVRAYVYARTCIRIRAYVHTYTRVRTYVYARTCIRIRAYVHTYTRVRTYVYARTYIRIRAYVHTYTRVRAYVYARTCIRIRAYVHTYTRVRAYVYARTCIRIRHARVYVHAYTRVRAYVYAYTCIRIRAYVYACTCILIRVYVHAYTRIRAHVYAYTCIRTRAHVHAYTRVRAYVYACTCMRTRVYVHTYTRIHAYARAHVHAYTRIHAYVYACTCIRTRAYARTYTRVRAYVYACTCMRTRVYVHAYTRIHAYAHAHVHAYTPVCACVHPRTCMRTRVYVQPSSVGTATPVHLHCSPFASPVARTPVALQSPSSCATCPQDDMYKKSPSFQELPANNLHSELHFWHQDLRPKTFAWITGVGIMHGRLAFQRKAPAPPRPPTDAAEPESVLKDSCIIPCFDSQPVGLAISEFHFYVLYDDRMVILGHPPGLGWTSGSPPFDKLKPQDIENRVEFKYKFGGSQKVCAPPSSSRTPRSSCVPPKRFCMLPAPRASSRVPPVALYHAGLTGGRETPGHTGHGVARRRAEAEAGAHTSSESRTPGTRHTAILSHSGSKSHGPLRNRACLGHTKQRVDPACRLLLHHPRAAHVRGCHKDAHVFFCFYYGIHSLMFGGYLLTAIGYPPTAIGYPPTAIGYPPAAIVGRIGHSEFFFFSLRHPLAHVYTCVSELTVFGNWHHHQPLPTVGVRHNTGTSQRPGQSVVPSARHWKARGPVPTAAPATSLWVSS